jgi:hypothetical protein
MKRISTPRLFHVAAVGCLAASASAQISIGVSTTPFTDIAATGTSPGTSSDDFEVTVTSATLSAAGWAGNELLPLGHIRIGNNGAVLWRPGAATEVGYINSTTFLTMAASNATNTGNGGTTAGCAMVCPLWDDHTPQTANGGANTLDWQVIGGNLIIQWTREAHFNAGGAGSANTVTFQMIAYGGVTIASGNTLVDFVYNDTFYAASLYQNDGGSATIGFKNWGSVAAANDVEFGMGGGNNTIGDPAFGDPSMRPKVGGYLENADPMLPHAVRIYGSIPAPLVFCPGDGTGTACPCGNHSAVGAGEGCLTSFGLGGKLRGAGSASLTGDTLVLSGSQMPNAPALYFQGTAQVSAGAGTVFGDGKRCAGGTVVRLKQITNVGGASQYPEAGDPPVSVRGLVTAPGIRTYQIWFRNNAAFCTPDGWNLSNGIEVNWLP